MTTGEVAKICNVAPRTVSKWFDSGQLRGYRIPGSKDRRIPLDQLIRFMRSHGMPLNGLATGQRRILILDSDEAIGRAVAEALSLRGDYDAHVATSVIEAGAMAYETKPEVIVVDVGMSEVAPAAISRWVHATEELNGTLLIGVAQQLGQAKGQALLQDGFDAYLSKPFEISALTGVIEERVATATG